MKGLFNITRTTANQARREPIYYIVTLIFAVLVYASQYLVIFVFEGEAVGIMETGIASITACGMLLAILLSWLLIRKEMEKMSILSVLSKPVSRFSFVSGKYLGLLYAIFLSILFLFLMFSLNLWQFDGDHMLAAVQSDLYQDFLTEKEQPGTLTVVFKGASTGLEHFFFEWIVPSFVGTVPALLTVAIVLAICAVSSLFFEILPTTGITLGFLVLGNLSGRISGMLVGEAGGLGTIAGTGLRLLIPDLYLYNIATDVGSRLSWSSARLFSYFSDFLLFAFISGILYIMVVLVTGTALFQRKEIT